MFTYIQRQMLCMEKRIFQKIQKKVKKCVLSKNKFDYAMKFLHVNTGKDCLNQEFKEFEMR